MGVILHHGFESHSLRHYKGIRSIWDFSDWPFFLPDLIKSLQRFAPRALFSNRLALWKCRERSLGSWSGDFRAASKTVVTWVERSVTLSNWVLTVKFMSSYDENTDLQQRRGDQRAGIATPLPSDSHGMTWQTVFAAILSIWNHEQTWSMAEPIISDLAQLPARRVGLTARREDQVFGFNKLIEIEFLNP